MKRLILLLFTVILVSATLTPLAVTAHAETVQAEVYAVAAQTDVWFYAAENDESGLFLMPYTYYVRVLKEGTQYCYVQYLDDTAPYRSVRGYCRTDALTFVDFIPERPYLRREITVTYNVSNPSDSLMGGGAFDRVEKTFVFYGASYSGTAKYYYVYADGVFDYVPAVQDVTFDLNTDYLKDTSGELPPEPVPQTGLSALQITVVCLVAVAVAGIAVFVLRGKKSASPQELPEF